MKKVQYDTNPMGLQSAAAGGHMESLNSAAPLQPLCTPRTGQEGGRTEGWKRRRETSGKQLSCKTQRNAAGERRCASSVCADPGQDLMADQQWIQGSAKPTAHLW